MAKSTPKLEKFKKELKDLMLEKVKQTDMKEWIEYGFYTSQGYLALISTGRIEYTNNPAHGMRWIKCMARQSLVDSLKSLRDSLAWNLPLVNWKPFVFVADMIEPLYQMVNQKEFIVVEDPVTKTSTETEYWAEVPWEARMMITLSIPSMLYMSVEMVKNTIEIAGIT